MDNNEFRYGLKKGDSVRLKNGDKNANETMILKEIRKASIGEYTAGICVKNVMGIEEFQGEIPIEQLEKA